MNTHRSIALSWLPASRLSGAAAGLALVLAGTALLTLSAKVSVPFFPVPMTFQSLVVLLIGAAFGPRLAAATLVAYLAEGAIGLPVFAGTPEKGIGLAYMAGPTGGFLVGFLLAAVLVGWLTRLGAARSFSTSALAVLAGTVAIYLPGLLWLGAVVGWDKPVLEWGLYPFLYGDALKLVIASLALPLIAGRVARG
ncbi:MAG: biotin transporter BioY [Rhizobiaceae bacterium]|nr:biotin transporter BioY [Rhizobiaceae bacterium]